jgi:hypothetical protein
MDGRRQRSDTNVDYFSSPSNLPLLSLSLLLSSSPSPADSAASLALHLDAPALSLVDRRSRDMLTVRDQISEMARLFDDLSSLTDRVEGRQPNDRFGAGAMGVDGSGVGGGAGGGAGGAAGGGQGVEHHIRAAAAFIEDRARKQKCYVVIGVLTVILIVLIPVLLTLGKTQGSDDN